MRPLAALPIRPAKHKTAYIAGPYSAPTPEGTRANIAAAVAFGEKVRALGGVLPLVPHVLILPTQDYEQAMSECFSVISRCADAVVLMPNWEDSPGAVREAAFAFSRVPVFHGVEAFGRFLEANR